MRHRHQLKSETRGARYKYIPSRELKCPTWGIRTSSSKVPAGRAYVSAQESIISINMKNAHTYREYSRCHRYIICIYIYICVCVRDCVWWIMLEKAYSFVTVMRVAICFASKYLVFLLTRLCTNIRP